MSIPLVQEATKDAINTSIIAIKRNIERINMLLGLSNSEEIDTSKFATKEELQQAVTDLQPVDEVTVDNMHSVSSNAVAESLSYSTTEQKTGGYWIDGKPIYRKIFYSATNWASSTIIGTIANHNFIVKIIDMEPYSSSEYYENYGSDRTDIANAHVKLNGEVVVDRIGGFANNFPSAVTIEYTKTTD